MIVRTAMRMKTADEIGEERMWKMKKKATNQTRATNRRLPKTAPADGRNPPDVGGAHVTKVGKYRGDVWVDLESEVECDKCGGTGKVTAACFDCGHIGAHECNWCRGFGRQTGFAGRANLRTGERSQLSFPLKPCSLTDLLRATRKTPTKSARKGTST